MTMTFVRVLVCMLATTFMAPGQDNRSAHMSEFAPGSILRTSGG